MNDNLKYFTAQELADHINVSRKFIEKHVSTHRIPGAVKIGRLWRFKRSEVEKRLLSGHFLLDMAEG